MYKEGLNKTDYHHALGCLTKNIKFDFHGGLSAIKELQTPTKLYRKESALLDKISDLQGVLKDFTVISALYMKIRIFG
jgi:hypothetical protein